MGFGRRYLEPAVLVFYAPPLVTQGANSLLVPLCKSAVLNRPLWSFPASFVIVVDFTSFHRVIPCVEPLEAKSPPSDGSGYHEPSGAAAIFAYQVQRTKSQQFQMVIQILFFASRLKAVVTKRVSAHLCIIRASCQRIRAWRHVVRRNYGDSRGIPRMAMAPHPRRVEPGSRRPLTAGLIRSLANYQRRENSIDTTRRPLVCGVLGLKTIGLARDYN